MREACEADAYAQYGRCASVRVATGIRGLRKMDMVSSVPTDNGSHEPSVAERLKRMQRIIAIDKQLQASRLAAGSCIMNSLHCALSLTVSRLQHFPVKIMSSSAQIRRLSPSDFSALLPLKHQSEHRCNAQCSLVVTGTISLRLRTAIRLPTLQRPQVIPWYGPFNIDRESPGAPAGCTGRSRSCGQDSSGRRHHHRAPCCHIQRVL